MSEALEDLARMAIDCGYKLHEALGPAIPIEFDGMVMDEGFRIDLLVANQLIVKLKSTEHHAPVHAKQVITYLRLMDLPLGLLMNFGAYTFKEGLRRLANNYYRPQR